MATSNIRDIELDQLIADAVRGDKEALARLRSSKWLTRLLHKISLRMAVKFNHIPSEIEDALSDAVCDKIETLRKPNRNSLAAWCWMTAKRFCLNKKRHDELEKEYLNELIHEGTAGKRKTAKNTSQALPVAPSNSPEKICLEREAVTLRNKLKSDLYFKVQEELKNLPPEDVQVLISWGSGKTLEQLTAETGIAKSTLSRHLKNLQKDIIKKIGIKQIVKDDPEQWKGVAELIRNSLKAMTPAA